MNEKELAKHILKHQTRVPRMQNQRAQALGNNPGILRPIPKSAPDNRVPIPIARQAVNFVVGYMGKPGNTTYAGDYYENVLKDIYDSNDEQLTSSGELEDACIHGACYELHWLDTQGKKRFYPIPVDQGIPIYSDDIKPELLGFIWYRTVDEVEKATYYDSKIKSEWIKTQADWQMVEEEKPHGYKTVPVNIGHIDRDGRNLFDHILPILDSIDKLASGDLMNEADRYQSAILAMAERMDTVSKDENGKTMVERMKEIGFIDGLGDGDIKSKIAFITKDLPVDFIKFAIEFLERQARECLQIPNMMDPKFGESSGISKMFQLLPLEYLCTRIEAHFLRFLYNRIYLIAGISEAIGDGAEGAKEVQISNKRNLPHDLTETAEIVAKLQGILSTETLLNLFPSQVIPDVEEELERLGAETVPALEGSPVDGL